MLEFLYFIQEHGNYLPYATDFDEEAAYTTAFKRLHQFWAYNRTHSMLRPLPLPTISIYRIRVRQPGEPLTSQPFIRCWEIRPPEPFTRELRSADDFQVHVLSYDESRNHIEEYDVLVNGYLSKQGELEEQAK